MQKAVGVLTSLCHKITASADTDIAADVRKIAADGKCGIHICCKQDLGEHGCCRGLAVCAAHSDRKTIIFHQLTEQLSPAQRGDPLFVNSDILGIVRMDSRRKDCQIDIICNVFSSLADHDPDP